MTRALRSRVRVGSEAGAPATVAAEGATSIDALAASLHGADTPYRAWAALVLWRGPDRRYREEAQATLVQLADAMPEVLEHGDLAAYALLARDLLTHAQRDRLVVGWPVPRGAPALRSRFYDSPALVYLAARGLGAELPHAPALAALVEREAGDLADRPSPALPGLLLRVATLLELRPGSGLPEPLERAVAGRLVALGHDAAAGTAAWWFLERYGARLAEGAGALRTALERFGTEAARDVRGLAADAARDPAVGVMALEASLGRARHYELVPAGAVAEGVRRHVARLRPVAAAALAIVALGASAGPMAYVWQRGRLDWVPALAATLGLGVPLAAWAAVWAYGRPRRLDGFVSAATLGLLYYGLALFAGVRGSIKAAGVVGEAGAVWGLAFGVITAVYVGLQGVREARTAA